MLCNLRSVVIFLLAKVEHTIRREISSAPGKLLQCSSWSFFSYSSPAFLVPKRCDSFSYQICTCQINPFTSSLSHSFQRCCSAFFLVISRLSSSSREEPLSCPSSPYEREQKVCVYLTDRCHAQTEGLGLNLQCATVLRLQRHILSLLVLKLTLPARAGKQPANIELTVVGL